MVNPNSLKNLIKPKSRKGIKNKFTKDIKQVFFDVFNTLQTKSYKKYSLLETAKEHPLDFYKTCAGLLPKEVGIGGTGGKPLSITVKVEK